MNIPDYKRLTLLRSKLASDDLECTNAEAAEKRAAQLRITGYSQEAE